MTKHVQWRLFKRIPRPIFSDLSGKLPNLSSLFFIPVITVTGIYFCMSYRMR